MLSMAHVGSPDTFFAGKAGPYDIRVSVRLPGVIPGRAQVAVRVAGATAGGSAVTVQAAQWNVGLKGAPPPEAAAPVPGDPALFSSELWFMTAQPYQLSVVVAGPAGSGEATVPVMAIATAERAMPPWLGALLAALGVFLTAGMLTIIGSAMRESVLPPGVEPDARRRRRSRMAVAIAAAIVALVLWGGNAWWSAEASNYGRFILYRPFNTTAAAAGSTLTLGIRDNRWTGSPFPNSRYNALLPDHGKLMHLFLVREQQRDERPTAAAVFAHIHPVARTPAGLDFDAALPAALPPGHYRLFGDIVHESGYAQTLVNSVELAPRESGSGGVGADADDSSFVGEAAAEAASVSFPVESGSRIVWERGRPIKAGEERELKFSMRDAAGTQLAVEPYMGMAAHVAVASVDGSVFAHLHPSGSVSMAALQRLSPQPQTSHDGHAMAIDGEVSIPYAFPKAGHYRMWVQMKRGGSVDTAAFDVAVQ